MIAGTFLTDNSSYMFTSHYTNSSTSSQEWTNTSLTSKFNFCLVFINNFLCVF